MFAAVDDLDPIKAAATSALKRVLADQLNEVLDARRRVDHPVSIDDLLPSQTTVFGDAIATMIAEAAQRGHRGLVPDWDPTPVTAAVSAEVGQALRRRVARLVESGTDDLDVRVRAVYREWRRERVEEVARQATTAAFNLGALAIVPDGTSVAWTMRDGDCPVEECAANTNAGPVAPGSVFPSGHVVPPVSAGCRCLVVPSDR